MTHPALIERITRSLAYMLRHQPEQFELTLDEYGWADLREVVRALNERLGEPVGPDDVHEAVSSGDRQRYEIDKGLIRALYGHSIDVQPGEPSKPPELLYVGVSRQDAQRAERFGLRPGRRRFLHLALTEDDALDTALRTSEDAVLVKVHAIDAWEEGINFYDRKALFLSDPIPTHYLEISDGDAAPYERAAPRGQREEHRGGAAPARSSESHAPEGGGEWQEEGELVESTDEGGHAEGGQVTGAGPDAGFGSQAGGERGFSGPGGGAGGRPRRRGRGGRGRGRGREFSDGPARPAHEMGVGGGGSSFAREPGPGERSERPQHSEPMHRDERYEPRGHGGDRPRQEPLRDDRPRQAPPYREERPRHEPARDDRPRFEPSREPNRDDRPRHSSGPGQGAGPGRGGGHSHGGGGHDRPAHSSPGFRDDRPREGQGDRGRGFADDRGGRHGPGGGGRGGGGGDRPAHEDRPFREERPREDRPMRDARPPMREDRPRHAEASARHEGGFGSGMDEPRPVAPSRPPEREAPAPRVEAPKPKPKPAPRPASDEGSFGAGL